MRAAAWLVLGAAAVLVVASCALVGSAPPPGPELRASELPPPEPREFRAAWVATVQNIDWPSRPGLASDAQRDEAIAILERARRLGLNAIVLQVRPAADALYPSQLEPWSEVLSGEQGRAPEPPWDPLAFWVGEAHRRGLELHAWFNPYRARHSSAKSAPAATHVAARRPELVRRYGEQLWLDPGEPVAAAHTLAVVLDVVRRYAIDAVHIDDYFYPYPVQAGGAEQPFPDEASWARAQLAGAAAGRSRDDWRRDNVNRLVRALYENVHAAKPWVRVGISPFGLPRPDRRPPELSGFSQYDKLYADVEHWLEQGWLDYLAPQLYWPIDRAGQAFPVLLEHWAAANAARGEPRHLWPGLFTSSLRTSASEPPGPRAWAARELVDQVGLVRQAAAAGRAGGHIHFSMAALMQDRDGIATLLQLGPYAEPALVPATPWLAGTAPAAPRLVREGTRLRIEPAVGADAVRFALWRRVEGRWRFAVLPAEERFVEREGADAVVLSAVGRTGLTSPRAAWRWSS